jgi:hypothetical protein
MTPIVRQIPSREFSVGRRMILRLRGNVSLFGCHPTPFHRFNLILCNTKPLSVTQAETILRFCVSLFCRLAILLHNLNLSAEFTRKTSVSFGSLTLSLRCRK